MKGWRAWIALVALATLGLCALDKRQQAEQQQRREQAPLSPLGLYDTSRPEEGRAQAEQALTREAYRRELRFQDAVAPGIRFAATRVEQRHIDSGHYTPEQLYDVGAQLFDHRFLPRDGFGGRDQATLRRVHAGARGGPDAHRCSSCHRRGGPAGAGDAADNAYYDGDGDRPDSAFERNPPALVGAGWVALAAQQMTRQLHEQRDALVKEARKQSGVRAQILQSKGVTFGQLRANAKGRLDYSKVRGIDADLIVKPFGWKGHTAGLRDMIEQQLALHHGMQSELLVTQRPGPALGLFGGDDPDGDGVAREISEGQLTALTIFVAMQEVPQVEIPLDEAVLARWADGKRQFEQLGCAGCHTPSLPLDDAPFLLPSREGQAVLRVDLTKHGAMPRLSAAADGGLSLPLYSDMKRHIVGPNLRDSRRQGGISAAEFMTPPLWGITRSGPYLHDGRAPTIEWAILEHGGEASEARDSYAALNDHERAPLRIFLASLTRATRVVVP